MADPPINHYEIRSDGWAVFRIPRCLLVFTHEEIKKAIKRGKIWRRHGGEKLTAKGGEDIGATTVRFPK